MTNCGRSSEEITLLAVSKTRPANVIGEAITTERHAFGENYVQEGVDKIRYSQEKGVSDLQWHFIGPLRSNKGRLVAEHFDRCRTVDRLRIAARLSEQRPTELPPLNVLIRINISDEDSRSDIPLAELGALVAEVATLPRITLRGLTAILASEPNYVRQFEVAQQVTVAFAGLKTRYPGIDTLSPEMSDDMDTVITAGSMVVCIGTAVFDARGYTKK